MGAGAEIESQHKTLRHTPWYTALTAPTAAGGAPSVYTRLMQQLRFTHTRTQYITRITHTHAVRPRPVRVADHRARALSRVPTHTHCLCSQSPSTAEQEGHRAAWDTEARTPRFRSCCSWCCTAAYTNHTKHTNHSCMMLR